MITDNGITGWAIKGPTGKLKPYSFRERKDEALADFAAQRAKEKWGLVDRPSPRDCDEAWEDAMKRGFKAVPAAVVETAV